MMPTMMKTAVCATDLHAARRDSQHTETYDAAKFHLLLLMLGIMIVTILSSSPDVFIIADSRPTSHVLCNS